MDALIPTPLVEPVADHPDRRTPTRSSFVERLRDWGDQSSWEGFFRQYGRLVRQAAVRSGLNAEEADDVVQETALSVAKKMPEFVYERSRCTFEGWVRHVARLRIADQLRRRLPGKVAGGIDSGDAELLEAIPDTLDGERVDAAWNEAWRSNLLQTALDRLQLKVSPEHFQIFHLSLVSGLPGPEVARTLGVSQAQVWVVRHRLTRLLQQEVGRLKSTPGGLG